MKSKTVITGVMAFVIIIASQVIWKAWAQSFAFYPLSGVMEWVFRKSTTLICTQVEAILQVFKPIKFLLVENRFYFPGGSYVHIASGCSGIKQIFHFTCLIMGSLSGSFRRKTAFVLFGIIILINFNVLRISILCITKQFIPEYWDFFHSTVFRFAFYVIILLLWIFWEESRLLSGSSLKKENYDRSR